VRHVANVIESASTLNPARGDPTIPSPHPAEERTRELPVVVIDSEAHWRRWWADLVAYRGALYSLARRNVRSRYKQAALGAGWALLQPLLQVAIFTLLFARIARVDTQGVPYPVFALAGLLVWNLFARIVGDAAVSLTVNQHIITKLFFPRIYLVLASAASAIMDALVGAGLVLVLCAIYDVALSVALLLAVPLLIATVLVAIGLGSLLAAVNARWRDVQHTVPFLLQLGLFVTPILYPASLVPERWQWTVAINPLSGLVGAFRAAVLGVAFPAPSIMATSLGISVAMLAAGIAYFTRVERTIVDVV
jgi:homopolymeric O-antigen transport system permease protein